MLSVIFVRMRKKKNLIPRMEKCESILLRDPSAYKGRWRDAFPGFSELHIELGCGKGRFTVETAQSKPETLFVAVERAPEAMITAMERAMASGLENVRFIDMDAAKLRDVFGDGEADLIYINFCDPWPPKKQAKRRLTAPGFLALYKAVLKSRGEIHFKTDNYPLFCYSLQSFYENGFDIYDATHDLHGTGGGGIMTDYEVKFHAQGVPINRCVAKKRD